MEDSSRLAGQRGKHFSHVLVGHRSWIGLHASGAAVFDDVVMVVRRHSPGREVSRNGHGLAQCPDGLQQFPGVRESCGCGQAVEILFYGRQIPGRQAPENSASSSMRMLKRCPIGCARPCTAPRPLCEKARGTACCPRRFGSGVDVLAVLPACEDSAEQATASQPAPASGIGATETYDSMAWVSASMPVSAVMDGGCESVKTQID